MLIYNATKKRNLVYELALTSTQMVTETEFFVPCKCKHMTDLFAFVVVGQ
jgi:hypothetical protein